MFSGAKHKLKQWRQRKTSAKIMNNIPKESFQEKIKDITAHLTNLRTECGCVIEQLNQQVSALSKIDEDTTVVAEKIHLLQDHNKSIGKGLQESEEFTTFFECVEALNTAINRSTSEIEDLHREATSLFNENRKLRTELQIFLDHHERSELRAVELEINVEHLKFTSSLPSDYVPLFKAGVQDKVKEDVEKFAIKPKVVIPFLEEDSIERTGSYILSVLDTLDFRDNSRLRILFDLIKSYIIDQAYDIAIPLLKTTVEDLVSKYSPHEKIVFTMLGVMVIVYNVTHRFEDAIEIEQQILEIRKESMPEDQTGLAQTLSSLALLYGKLGKVKTARNFCRQALDLKNKFYGERDLETAKEFHNMGVLYSIDGKHSKAIDCLITAINIMRTSSKKSVCWLAGAAANLALIHIQNGELLDAKHLFNSTLTFLHKELGKLLEGKNIKEEMLVEDKINELSDCENKNEIQKIIHLLAEITEKAKSVTHMEPNDKDIKGNYKVINISDDE